LIFLVSTRRLISEQASLPFEKSITCGAWAQLAHIVIHSFSG
jgi:hypothetical protein